MPVPLIPAAGSVIAGLTVREVIKRPVGQSPWLTIRLDGVTAVAYRERGAIEWRAWTTAPGSDTYVRGRLTCADAVTAVLAGREVA